MGKQAQSPRQLSPGCYRIASGVRLVTQEGRIFAITEYPLRIVPLSATLSRLLTLCDTEQICEQLARGLSMSGKRVEALCDQLRWKNLLEAGPALLPPVLPTVSIVIPSYNRAKELERCLQSLFCLDYPSSKLEVIVVDDASTDGTAAMLRRAMVEHTNLRVILHPQWQGVGHSRNTGSEFAQHELIAYIDSDCIATPDWLTQLVPTFQDPHVAAVGGMIRAYERKSMIGRYEDVRSSLFMGKRAQQVCLEGPLTYVPTANLLVRRSMWQQLGGFAPMMQGEDVDFCHRLLLTSTLMYYVPQGIVYHDYRTNLRAFLGIRTAYASSEAALLKRHAIERRVLLLPPEQATFAGLVIGALWMVLTVIMKLLFWHGMVKHVEEKPLVPVGAGVAARWGWGPLGRPTLGKHDAFCVFSINRATQGSPPIPTATPAPTGTNGIFCKGRPKDPHPTTPQPPPLRRRAPSPTITLFIAFLSVLGAFILTLVGARNRLQKVRKQHLPVEAPIVLQATTRGHLSYTYQLCRHITRYYTLPLLLVGIMLPPLLLFPLILCGIVVGVDYVRLKPKMTIAEYTFCSVVDDCAYEVGVVQGCVRHRMWKPLVPIVRSRI